MRKHIINGIINRLKKAYVYITAPIRRKKLNNIDFSIISNNCWGGDVYRYFGLPYSSPTVGLYFWADEYLKFVANLKHYFSCSLEFIDVKDSEHYEVLQSRGEESKIVGKLDDIEIVFLHYHSREEAKEKWERRKNRINYNNLIIKFSEMNGCTVDDLEEFDNLELPNSKKIMFVSECPCRWKCAVVYRYYINQGSLPQDIPHYRRYVDITHFINTGEIVRRENE